jgi:beta-glucosidase
VMCAYMALNGVPATGNKWLLTDILKQEWGFDGFTVSDANSAYDLCEHNFARDPSDAGVRALNAGLDVEMSLLVKYSAFRNLPGALARGEIDEAKLDDAVRRVLTAKFKMGLFEQPYIEQAQCSATLSNPEHRDKARDAAERSFVLLRNDNQLLPLKQTDLRTIAVIGPLADSARDTLGPWVFDHDLAETVTVLSGIREKVKDLVTVTHSPGVSMIARQNASFFDSLPGLVPAERVEVDDDAEIERAVELAQAADCVILVLGEAQNMIGEAASRSALDLPGRQQELLEAVISTGKPVVLLLMNARPLDLKGAQPNAILNIWYPGSQGGAAVANVLFGEAVPSGKLPFNWVRSVGQVPLPYSRMKSHRPDEREVRYWNEDGSPLYPFGFGLSYSKFSYSNLRIARETVALGETVNVHVDVTNAGDFVAAEIAQLYIHQRHGSAARPVRELKGFSREVLAPGETRTIEFNLSAEDLTYWSSSVRDWVQDETIIDIFVGADSAAQLSATFEVRRSQIDKGDHA